MPEQRQRSLAAAGLCVAVQFNSSAWASPPTAAAAPASQPRHLPAKLTAMPHWSSTVVAPMNYWGRPESSQRNPGPFSDRASRAVQLRNPGPFNDRVAGRQHITLDPAAHHPVQLLLNPMKGDFFKEQFPLNFFSFKVLVCYLLQLQHLCI
ncbi:hypothetical protein ACQJBY_068693 [Aegilops geniculata]